MHRVLMVGIDIPVKLKIKTDEQYFEVYVQQTDEPFKYPYDDPCDIINVVERYTTLSHNDIQRIIDVCEHGW